MNWGELNYSIKLGRQMNLKANMKKHYHTISSAYKYKNKLVESTVLIIPIHSTILGSSIIKWETVNYFIK